MSWWTGRRPKLSVGTRCNCFRYGFFIGHRPGNLAERQLSDFLTGGTRPTAAAQVASGERLFRNMSCRWRFDPAATAMGWSPDIGQEIRSSGGFLIPHPAVVDPLLPVRYAAANVRSVTGANPTDRRRCASGRPEAAKLRRLDELLCLPGVAVEIKHIGHSTLPQPRRYRLKAAMPAETRRSRSRIAETFSKPTVHGKRPVAQRGPPCRYPQNHKTKRRD